MDLEINIEENKEKFLNFNRIKFHRFQQFVSSTNTRRVINAIPFLLSVNHKKLPGFIEEQPVYGVYNYVPEDETKRFIRSKFPAVKLDNINDTEPFVEMLAVMGSIGTIAYNKKSDFDYWICVNRKKISAEQFAGFKKKADTVQKWAASEIKLPVHMYVNDIDLVQQNIFAEDDEEALGSTVGSVLKDEFLRSSIIICGKIPFWWVIPQPVPDDEYNRIKNSIPADVFEKDFIDLGNLYKISRGEFLGAALFQIIKSLGNPFKSIIKLGVLEKYLSGDEDAALMSQKVKSNVLKGNFENEILDSYLMMFKEVYDYYSLKITDASMLNMLRKNLYLKIDPQLSKYVGVKDNKNIPYKVMGMFRYVKEWKWKMDTITDLDNFDNWDFNKVIDFWDSVKRFMLMSYQNISVQLPALKVEKQVSESDFLLLSRKIKTHFKRENDKIEQFITFKDTPSEGVLYMEPISEGIHDLEWRLYKRNSRESNTFITTTLKTETNLLKLLVWVALNQIYDPVSSRLNIQSGYSRVNQQQVLNLLNQISEFFRDDLIHAKNEYLLDSAFNLLNFIIINFDTENLDSIQKIHHLYHTSWGESYLKSYKTEDDLAQILFMVLKDGIILNRSFENYCAVNTPDPYKKHNKRIITNFKEAYAAIVEDRKVEFARYITRIGDKFYLYTRNSKNVECDSYPGIINLLAAITLKPRKEIKYSFFSDEPALAVQDKVYKLSVKHSLTIGYEEKGSYIVVYLVNEKGNMFTFIKPLQMKDDCLVYFKEFCQNLVKRVSRKDKFSDIARGGVGVYFLKTDRFGKLTVTDDTERVRSQLVLKRSAMTALIASVAKHQGEQPTYNIIYPDKTSSGFIELKDFGSVSKKIGQLNKDGFPVVSMVRDIVFNDLSDEEIKIGSTLHFLEKYRIESILEKMAKKH